MPLDAPEPARPVEPLKVVDNIEDVPEIEITPAEKDKMSADPKTVAVMMSFRADDKWKELAERTPPQDLADERIMKSFRIKMDEMRGFINAALRNELSSTLSVFNVENFSAEHTGKIENHNEFLAFSNKIDKAFEQIFADPQAKEVDSAAVELVNILARTNQQIANDYEHERIAVWNKGHAETGHEHECPEMNAIKVGSTIKVVNLEGDPIDATVVAHTPSGALVVEYVDKQYYNNYRYKFDASHKIMETKGQRTVGIDEYMLYNQQGAVANENREVSNEQSQLIVSLWPRGFESDKFKQGATGDCYLLAGWESIKTNYPDVNRLMAETIRAIPGEGKGYVVNFKGVPGRDIIVTEAELLMLDGTGKAIQIGAKGDRILELAYAKLVQARKSGEIEARTMEDMIDLYDDKGTVKKELEVEGGQAVGVFVDILGTSFKKGAPSNKGMMRDVLANYEAGMLAVAGSTQSPENHEGGKPADTETYIVLDTKGVQQKIYHEHAYSVKSVDSKNGTIVLVDPHNTAAESMIFTHEIFVENFDHLDLIATQQKQNAS